MAVAVNSVGNIDIVAASTASVSCTPAGSDRVLFATIHQWENPASSTTAWDFNTSEAISDINQVADVLAFSRNGFLIAPTATADNLTCDFGIGVVDGVLGFTSCTGVDQTTAFDNAATAIDTGTITITTNSSNDLALVASMFAAASGISTGNEEWTRTILSTRRAAVGSNTGATSATVAWTETGAREAIAGFNAREAAAGGGRIMSSLTKYGGLAAHGGIAGKHGGLAA